MPVTASGILSLPKEHLRTLLANSATWQTWSNSLGAEAAKASIHIGEVSSSLLGTRPWALIGTGRTWRYTRTGTGSFSSAGSLLLIFLADVPEAYADSWPDAEMWFSNQVGAALKEIATLAADESQSYLRMQEIVELDPPFRADESRRQSEGDWIQAVYEVSWA